MEGELYANLFQELKKKVGTNNLGSPKKPGQIIAAKPPVGHQGNPPKSSTNSVLEILCVWTCAFFFKGVGSTTT